MDINKDKNYRKLEKMIKKAAKDFTHYIYADNEDTIGTMCNLQGYCEAYYDLGLITKEQFYKLDELIQNMNNVIRLVEDIIKNMEYVRILFKRDKDITPLNTFNSVIDKLNKLKYILENDILTPEQIMEAVRRLERPIKPDEDIYKGTGTPIMFNTFTGENPFNYDSIGEEELHEDTEN